MGEKSKVCFFVTSVIEPQTTQPFTYGCRSIYTSKERRIQTINTVKSIRLYMPDASIVFVEGGGIYDSEIANQVSKYIYLGGNFFVKKAVNNKCKAWGEIVLTLIGCFYWIKYAYVFKISGRYQLTNKFNRSKWIDDKITGLDIYGDNTQISTRLVGIPRQYYYTFLKAILRRIWRIPNSNCVYEAYILKGIGLKNINFISPIGIYGKIGNSVDEINE